MQTLTLDDGTLAELGVVLGLCAVPSDLGDSQSTRIEHILYMLCCRHVFGPEVSLHTGDLVAYVLGQSAARHVAVYLFERKEAADSLGLSVGSVLIVVEIPVAAGREHYVVAVVDGLLRLFETAPNHYGGVLGEVARNHFVPTYELSSVFGEKLAEVGDEVRLQTVLVCAKLLHLLLAERTRRP